MTWPARTALGELEVPVVTARYLVAARLPPDQIAQLIGFVGLRAVQRALWKAPANLRNRTPLFVRRSISKRLKRTVQRHAALGSATSGDSAAATRP